MLKKLVSVLFIVLLLCGCKDSRTLILDETEQAYKALGYDDATIKRIMNLSETGQDYFKRGYNQKLVDLVLNNQFQEDKIESYLKYNFSTKNLLYLVNNDIVNDSNYSIIQNCYLDKWFIKENLELYLEYSKDFFNARDCIEYVNTKSYLPDYEMTIESNTSDGIYMIANKHYYLGEYEPENLVSIPIEFSSNKHHQLQQEACDAYVALANAAKETGIYIYATSAYRSYDYQVNLYNNYLKVDPQDVVDTYSSRAGFSDHQIGLTVDILCNGCDFSNFEFSKEAKWLAENAYRYGFILRYPKGKQDITGYIYEAWHFRYVGIDAAAYIQESGITFDEYYACYIEEH